jgi:hypothetical protein
VLNEAIERRGERKVEGERKKLKKFEHCTKELFYPSTNNIKMKQ